MNLKSTIELHASSTSAGGGGQSWLVHPAGLKTDTPVVRDMARRRLVKTNPDVDAAKVKKKLTYKEKSQTDENAFVGKKYRTQDTKYGHLINEYDSSAEAFKSSLARPYTRVLRNPEPNQVAKNRNRSRKNAEVTNPDIL